MHILSQRRHIAALIISLFLLGDKMGGILDDSLAVANAQPTPQELSDAKSQITESRSHAESLLSQHEIDNTTRVRMDPSILDAGVERYGLTRRASPLAPSGHAAIRTAFGARPNILAAVRERQAGISSEGIYPHTVPVFPDEESFQQASHEVQGNAFVNPEDLHLYSRPLRASPKGERGNDTAAYDPIIEREAKRFGLEPALVKAVVYRESYFNPKAVSSAGAKGLMQLMPATAKDMGVNDPFDPAQNIHGGSKYLALLMDRYDGDMIKAVAAYNAGMVAVDKHNGVPPIQETKEYVDAVSKHYSRFSKETK